MLRYLAFDYKNKDPKIASILLDTSIFSKSVSYLGLGILLFLQYNMPFDFFKSSFGTSAGKYVAVMAFFEGTGLLFDYIEKDEEYVYYLWRIALIIILIFIILTLSY